MRELATLSDMKPYLELAKAVIKDVDVAPEALEAIRQLPLEKRYVWRVASEDFAMSSFR